MAGKSQHKDFTDLQLRFCHEYVKDLNGTKAVYRAGYDVKSDNAAAVQSVNLLRNPKIQAYLGEIAGLNEVTIIAEVLKIAFFQITDVAEWDGSDYSIKPTAEWSASAKSAIKSLTFPKTENRGVITTTIKVEAYDKLSAIEKLIKKYRLYPKDIPVLDAVTLLLNEGVATPDQARIVTEGIARIQSDLKGEISDRSKE